MKTVLIIFCAFLLKAEMQAQTWQKISPLEAKSINIFRIFKDNKENLHFFAAGSKDLYYSRNGSLWFHSLPNGAGLCHTYSDKYGNQVTNVGYEYQNIIQTDSNSFFITAGGVCAGGSMDYTDIYGGRFKGNRLGQKLLGTFNYFKS